MQAPLCFNFPFYFSLFTLITTESKRLLLPQQLRQDRHNIPLAGKVTWRKQSSHSRWPRCKKRPLIWSTLSTRELTTGSTHLKSASSMGVRADGWLKVDSRNATQSSQVKALGSKTFPQATRQPACHYDTNRTFIKYTAPNGNSTYLTLGRPKFMIIFFPFRINGEYKTI